ncbi:MAG: GNAT family N-acetyltransferase [Bacteroidota bacterium]
MTQLLRTNPQHPDYQRLVAALDASLRITDGEEFHFYAQFNKSDAIKYVLLVQKDEQFVACGAIKAFDAQTMEVKRMFVAETHRNQGIASTLLKGLEKWILELGYQKSILETGVRQLAAIRLYEKNAYQRIPNYGQYVDQPSSVCFAKHLDA